MTKNIRVINENGEIIGHTYPKRMKGLLKNGRAELVGDCEIRLRGGYPTENDFEFSEDTKMTKIINFDASAYTIRPECKNYSYSKEVITDDFGNNVFTYKLGNWQWDWCQIDTDMTLEKDTDYIFRFAVAGGYNHTFNAVSRFIISKNHSDEDYFGYNLSKSSFKPVLSKVSSIEREWLRVFEVKFNTGDCTDFTFSFAAQLAEMRILPAMENEAYAELADCSYEQLCEKIKRENSENKSNSANDLRDILNDFAQISECDDEDCGISDGENNSRLDTSESVKAASNLQNDRMTINMSGTCMSAELFAAVLKRFDELNKRGIKVDIDLSGACIG